MAYLKIKDKRITLYTYVTLLFIFYFTYLGFYPYIEDDISLSVWYILSSIISIYVVWNASGKEVNLLFMHLLTFQLFIGGRFYVHLFDNEWDIFETTFFYDYVVNRQRAQEIVFFPISYQIFITIGYCIAQIYPVKCFCNFSLHENVHKYINKIINGIFPYITVAVFFISVKMLVSVLLNGYGVSLIDISQQEVSVSIIDKFTPLLLIFLLALSYVYADKKLFYKYLVIYFVNGIIIIIGGSRGTLGVVIMLAFWFYAMNHKISLVKISLSVFAGMIMLIALFLCSARNTEMEELSPINIINYFIWSNGISLMVFDTSRLVDNYPIIPYFQTFITGFSSVISLFKELKPQDIGFEGHLCYTLNPVLYSSGAGLGWTSLGDFYLFSARQSFAFCFLVSIFGHILSTLEKWGKEKPFFKYVCISLAPGLLMSPRGGLFSFFPLFAYIFFFFLMLRTLATRMSKNTHR